MPGVVNVGGGECRGGERRTIIGLYLAFLNRAVQVAKKRLIKGSCYRHQQLPFERPIHMYINVIIVASG